MASAVAALLNGAGASAAGFQLLEQNASGLGTAFAGSAAVASDASTVYFNPAGMAWLPTDKTSLAVGGDIVAPSAKFTNRDSVAATGQPLGSNGGEAGSTALVPFAYLVTPVSPRISFGLGISAPFGLKTEYDRDWSGRFLAIKSSVETINLNPSVSFKLSDTLSLGVGLNYQRLDGEFTNAVNYVAILSQMANSVPALAPLVATAGEGIATIKGDDSGWGYNLGILYQISPDTRMGIAYRSRINYHLTGSAAFTPNAAVTAALSAIAGSAGQAAADSVAAALPTRGGDIRTDITLPDTFALSVAHHLNDRWDLLGDVSWVGWAKIPVLAFHYVSGPDNLTPNIENWRNTWRLAVGAHYAYNERWKLRMGMAYDQTPVRDANRTPRLPDANRTWLSLGTQYTLDNGSTIDLAYTHIRMPDRPIDDNLGSTAAYGQLLGTYKNHVNILGVQYSATF